MGRGRIEQHVAAYRQSGGRVPNNAEPICHARSVCQFGVSLAVIADHLDGGNRIVHVARVGDRDLNHNEAIVRDPWCGRVAKLIQNLGVYNVIREMPNDGLFPGRHHTNFFMSVRNGCIRTSAKAKECPTEQRRNEDTHLVSSFAQRPYVDNLKTTGAVAINDRAELSSI